MTKTLRTILSVSILSLYGFAFVGCNSNSSEAKTDAFALNDTGDDEDAHEHADHDHDDHDHPAHGPRGGHMIELEGDATAEWMLDDESDLFSVMLDKTGEVTKVEMKTTIDGKETVYEFEKSDTPVGPVFGLKSPELATAVKMGESVETKLVITTEEGELTAPVVHHAH